MRNDALYNRINERIINGYLPDEILTVVPDYSPSLTENDKWLEEGLSYLRNDPKSLYECLVLFNERVKELNVMKNTDLFEMEVSILVDMGYFGVAGSLCYSNEKICVAVTDFDKILWYGAYVYYSSCAFMPDDERIEIWPKMMMAWIHLLKTVQKKEMKYGLSVNFEGINENINVVNLIEADWQKVDKKYFSRLTDYGKRKMQETNEAILRMSERVKKDGDTQCEVAKATDAEWRIFIELLNDLSQKERNVLDGINCADSPKEKIKIIKKYTDVIETISRKRYYLNEEEYDLESLYTTVQDRLYRAPFYCVAKTPDGKRVRINPAVMVLACKPRTFNFLYITFHDFRLKPGKDKAKSFTGAALSAIKKNLGESEDEHVSLEEMIVDFCETVMRFVNSNAEAIGRLSFKSIQKDVAVVAKELSLDVTDAYFEDMTIRVKETERDAQKHNEDTYKMIDGNWRMHTAAELETMKQAEEKRSERIEQEAIARRVIVSLNIIYMFCDALRIMLTNRHACIVFNNRARIEKCRQDLQRIDEKLIRKVYADLNEEDLGMLEYREKLGINVLTLTEQENIAEKYRSDQLGEILKNTISSLIDSINEQNAEQLLETKKRIREEIFRFPDCDEKERYIRWIDEVSQKISGELVSKCRKENEYDRIKADIMTKLGEKAAVLPDSTLDSLTTAEILYSRYVSDAYAQKGFDYSGISSLYYQAFEEAYNKLVWCGYANMLNTLEINGRKYTDILKACKDANINVAEAIGYLEKNPDNRSFYVNYKSIGASGMEALVNSHCMYMSFAIILKKIVPSTELVHFCDYIAQLTGFADRNKMYNDVDFMRGCQALASLVEMSSKHRNNASHGGTRISMNRCVTDRKAVLGELEAIDGNSLGLMQRLVFLLNKQAGH